jgi:hypothetical protein
VLQVVRGEDADADELGRDHPSGERLTINPGIRNTVAWLQQAGYVTCDSGDGRTHDHPCDRDYPYVSMIVPPGELVEEADRLVLLLRDRGIAVTPMEGEQVAGRVHIQASYDPANAIGILDVMGLDDGFTP